MAKPQVTKASREPEKPVFFASPEDFRDWLALNHATANVVWVGYHRKSTNRPSMTWPQSVDEALCFGWIDGVRKKVDGDSYKIRFTPRKQKSTWSAVNISRVAVLTRERRMQPAGVAAFARREESNSGIYAFENQKRARLTPTDEKLFRTDAAAWTFFEAQPPGYRRLAAWRVVSAKRAETRAKRLAGLISASRNQQRI